MDHNGNKPLYCKVLFRWEAVVAPSQFIFNERWAVTLDTLKLRSGDESGRAPLKPPARVLVCAHARARSQMDSVQLFFRDAIPATPT